MQTREEQFFEKALSEIESNLPARGIWAKAFSLAEGDDRQTKALYLRLRVEQLEREHQELLAYRDDLLRKALEAGTSFTCPHCKKVGTAVRQENDFFLHVFGNVPRYRYYCPSCATEHKPGGSTSPPPVAIKAVSIPDGGRRNNPMAVAGFVLGLVSMVLYVIGIIPVLAVILSGIGLAGFNPEVHRNRWMGVAGLVLGIVFTLVMLAHYKHI